MSGQVAPLRGALIGCGFFGGIQLEAWRRMEGVEIVAACDPRLELARAAAPRAYTTAEELLEREKLDFVDIATRPESHLELVTLAAARGVAVICQKPMAPSWEEALALEGAARQAGIRCMIHENWRWQPWHRQTARFLAEGRIGNPITYTLRTRKADGMGSRPYPQQPYFAAMPRLLIYETLVHHIDTARYWFGDIVAVYAQARRVNPVIAGEDQALLTLHHPALAGIVDGHRFLNPVPDGPAMGEAIVEGDAGVLRIAATGDIFINQELVWRNTITAGYRGDSVRATQEHFVSCLRSGAPFESDVREYLKTFAAVEAAYRSLQECRAVAISELLCALS